MLTFKIVTFKFLNILIFTTFKVLIIFFFKFEIF